MTRGGYMRICIDARFVGPEGTGLGKYTEKLIENLAILDDNNQYVIFLRRSNWDWLRLKSKNFKKVLADIPWYSLKEQIKLPKIFSNQNLDLLHFTHFNVPVFFIGKFIVTIHDLIVDHVETGRASTLPYPLYKIKRLFYRRTVKSAVKRASAIIAISQNTKNEIVSHYHVDPQKITVTYDGLDSNIKRPEKFSSLYPFDYLLNVGNAYPHKNLETLIEVF